MQTSTAQGTADRGLFIPIEPSLISSRNAQQSVPSKRNLSGNERERSLGFRFDKVDYMIKGWECYKLTKINRVYFTPAIFIESKELTPPIGYVATEDGEQRFSISLQHRKNFVDNRIGTCWVDDLGEFLYLCERLGCYVEVDIVGLEVFLQAHEEDLILNRWSTPKILP